MSNRIADIPILVGTGLTNQYKAGVFYENEKIKFSTYIPNNIKTNLKFMYEDVEEFCNDNNYDLDDFLKEVYVLGPIYIENDIQIGFTGSSKFSKRGNIEPYVSTLPRELFEESGLYLDNRKLKNIHITKHLNEFLPVNMTINKQQSLDIINNKYKVFDYNKIGFDSHNEKILKKKRRHASSLIYLQDLSDFKTVYNNSKSSFNNMIHLFADDNIIGIGCMNLYQIRKYQE